MARTLLDSSEQSLARHVLTQATQRHEAIIAGGDHGLISLVGSSALLLAILHARDATGQALWLVQSIALDATGGEVLAVCRHGWAHPARRVGGKSHSNHKPAGLVLAMPQAGELRANECITKAHCSMEA